MSARVVRLADGLTVPAAELATKVVAALGMRGSGKSNEMAVIAEQLLAAGIQVIVLDDVGIWFSLRLKPDGKTSSGFDIHVLGGRHGDIPLLPTAGEVVAQALATTGSSAVLDISGFRKGERAKFAAAFAETLFRAKQNHPGPCFVILEESQRWVPQVIRFKGEGEERMLGAFMEIAEVGRNYGIGLGLLSQRPQKVHKEVLNLTELLFAFQTNGVHERKAIAEWVQETGAAGRAEVHGELPSLPNGEALVWSPAWLRMFKRLKLPKKTTYDAGATPLTARAQVKTKPLELGELSHAMAQVTEEAKASDPKALRAEVARLKAELAKGAKAAPSKPGRPEVVERVPAALRRTLAALGKQAERLTGEVARVAKASADLAAAVEMASKDAASEAGSGPAGLVFGASGVIGTTVPRHGPRQAAPTPPTNGEWRPQGGALRMLQAIAASHKDGLTWKEVARLAVMKASGGSYGTYKSAVRTHACVEERGDLVYLTPQGRAFAGDAAPQTGVDLLAFWQQKLQGKAKVMLETLVQHGQPMTRGDLAERVGMEAGGGSFGTYLSALRSNGLVEDTDLGIAAAEVFFQ
jgi:hypothetical protein